MNILQVSTHDYFGGAEAIMRSLHRGYRDHGLNATVAFGEQHLPGSDGIFLDREKYGSWGMRQGIAFSNFIRRQIPPTWKPWYKKWVAVGFSQPARMVKRMMGWEDFDHPVSRSLLGIYQRANQGRLPDLLHFHTLHGDYFDFRQLPELAEEVPLFVTLHDEWMMTGHCAYTLDCERWRKGCGHCPYLDSYPAISRDATARNFKRKREICRRAVIRVAAPSRWLVERFRQSPMSKKVIEIRHIPNGIDLEVFRPRDQKEAREVLSLANEETIFLFAARGGRANRYKDFQTIQDALLRLKERRPTEKISLVVLGERSESLEGLGFPVRFEEVNNDPARMALFYQAADLYLHAANAENYPTVILEAMACGTPVVATAVGGIPEQIEDGVDGFLVPPQDSTAMAAAIEKLLKEPELRRSFSSRAIERAKRDFDERKMIEAYLEWYKGN